MANDYLDTLTAGPAPQPSAVPDPLAGSVARPAVCQDGGSTTGSASGGLLHQPEHA